MSDTNASNDNKQIENESGQIADGYTLENITDESVIDPDGPEVDPKFSLDKIKMETSPTRDEIVLKETKTFLKEYDRLPRDKRPDPMMISRIVISRCNQNIDAARAGAKTKDKSSIAAKMPGLLSLLPSQIALILTHTHHIARISTSKTITDPDYELLGVYQTTGTMCGTYTTSDDVFRAMIRALNFSITKRDIEEIMLALRDMVPEKRRCDKPNYIAVANGIFDYDAKTLMPFTPDEVFLTKSLVRYNPNAKNIPIHNDKDGSDWDVESWMKTLSDDPQIVNVLWEIIGAVIRPNVAWNKSAWLYSESGNSGKGTLCKLMREIVGEANAASIALNQFGRNFLLEGLVHASAIIVDENDVGTFIDKAADLKAVITGDVLTIDRKFRTPMAYEFHGFMVQCLNEYPKIRDKSDSFYRRQLFIPMTKCFTGSERRYIKNDYLTRPEVLEYVLKRVLNMDYYELSEPAACREILNDYKEFNNPIHQFWNEVSDSFTWDMLPFGFLFDLYKSWLNRYVPGGMPVSNKKFINEIINETKNTPWLVCEDKNKQYRVKSTNIEGTPEPLINEYNLESWCANTNATNPRSRCTLRAADLKDKYRGLMRNELTPDRKSYEQAVINNQLEQHAQQDAENHDAEASNDASKATKVNTITSIPVTNAETRAINENVRSTNNDIRNEKAPNTEFMNHGMPNDDSGNRPIRS